MVQELAHDAIMSPERAADEPAVARTDGGGQVAISQACQDATLPGRC